MKSLLVILFLAPATQTGPDTYTVSAVEDVRSIQFEDEAACETARKEYSVRVYNHNGRAVTIARCAKVADSSS